MNYFRLSCEGSESANRQLLHESAGMPPEASGEQSRRLTRAQVEAVIADKEAVVQAAMDEYARSQGPLWKAMFEHERKQGRWSKKHEERDLIFYTSAS